MKELITVEQYIGRQIDPFRFIKDVWGLDRHVRGEEFVKGKMITRQQAQAVEAVRLAINGQASNKISIRSGKGIGKSAIMAMLVLWFLICYKDCQIPCTAPTESHLNTVLWKELAIWISRMPKYLQELIDYTSDFVRMKANSRVWFAMAKVGKKENAEAIAGIHADYIFVVVDEASGIDEEIFGGLRGVFTSGRVIFIMISNPTRLNGYFFNSHCSELRESFQSLHFNALESPLVDKQLSEDIKLQFGEEGDEYRVDILGEFPSADSIDDKGYVSLVEGSDLHFSEADKFVGTLALGVDPAGEGDDMTVWVIRDAVKARIIKSQKVSNGKGIAGITATLMTEYGIRADNVIVDNFGIGVDCIQELAFMGYMVNSLYLGKESNNKEVYMNKRAELYWLLREWLKKGGELYDKQEKGWEELLTIKYRRTEQNQIQIKPKKEMKKDGISSPDFADALMLTMDADFSIDNNTKPVFANWVGKDKSKMIKKDLYIFD